MIAFLTDVEGRWDKIVTFATNNPNVSLVADELHLAEGTTFVFGGDALDRGPRSRKIVRTLLAAKRRYGERVVLLAGNRDINKLRLARELDAPPARAPKELVTHSDRLRWIFVNTMGAPRAFEFRAAELADEGRANDPEAVARSYLDDLAPGGELRAYLQEAQLAYRQGVTLFVHGGVTKENVFQTPDAPIANTVDAWVAALNGFYRDELASFVAGSHPARLIAYQTPDFTTHLHQSSVVYARPTDSHGNPELPPPEVIAALRANGIERIVVGHTPSGDCPAIVRDHGFELVLGDNSYGRVEHGSQLSFTDDTTTVSGTCELDDGTRVHVASTTSRHDVSPLGLRDQASGQLVKAVLDHDRYLLFRGLPERHVEQIAASSDDVARRLLVTPR